MGKIWGHHGDKDGVPEITILHFSKIFCCSLSFLKIEASRKMIFYAMLYQDWIILADLPPYFFKDLAMKSHSVFK